MEKLNINNLLDREHYVKKIKDILYTFETNKNDPLVKKGIYIYGNPGSGKTSFVVNILKELNYDVIKYDTGDIRNKAIIETITKNNMSDKNIMSMFHKKIKKIAIIMDEIDGMNNGDKGGINSLIKLIRPKKTKKQKLEEMTMSPIFCIGNYHIDKKIKELMKVCNVIEIKTPTNDQIRLISNQIFPNINEKALSNIISYCQGDLKRLNSIYEFFTYKKDLLNKDIFEEIFEKKSHSDDTKNITGKLFENNYNIHDHLTIMNETDRTIVGLLWHENIIDQLEKYDNSISIPFYYKLLNNMCFSDYIDRITFQKQIWQFNEMTSLIKTFNNNKLYNEFCSHNTKQKYSKSQPLDIRFTKVLTKYSTEYNNSTFIQNLCQKLGMDKKDTYSLFLELREKFSDSDLIILFENYDIYKLDINRMYRYLDKYIKEDAETIDDVIVDSFQEAPCGEDMD
jgi:DNA polymerase III delta prime subunit